MNFALKREIYGGTPWMVDPISFMALSSILKDSQSGVQMELPQIKYNTPELINASSETRIITRPFGNEWAPGQLENKESFEGIGIINLDGPITLSGGASSIGMEQLSSMMKLMSLDSRMVGFIVRSNSGGGSSSAVDTIGDTIKEIDQKIPVYGSIKKGGMAASACYGILTNCRKIFSEDAMNIVGSAGTMVQFEGRKANTQDPDGVKHIRIYATKSVKKNESFEQALNNDNYEPIINNLLDPINEHFLSKQLTNRPQLAGSNYEDGHTLFSKDAIGTFIDGIASFDEVIGMVLSESKITENPKININSKSNKMNKAELKSAHPETFNEILSEGVNAERERVMSWMAYSQVDSEAVEAGIKSTLDISPSQRENFNVKMQQGQFLANMVAESAPAVVTAPSQTTVTEEETETQKVDSEWMEAAKSIK